MEQLILKSGNYKLERIPHQTKGDLRAWDAADELLIHTVFDEFSESLSNTSAPVLIINDSFGALAVAFNQYKVESWSDSYISHLATQHNLKNNQLPENTQLIAATDELNQKYSLVLIKIPKTLGLLEDQLCRLKPHITEDTIIIAAAMSKHIHTSTLKLFEKIIGTTTTSRATKKARLIYSKNDNSTIINSPYPKIIKDESLEITLNNYANVFSKDHLDIGTRFFIAQLKNCPPAKHILDLGCGNGALGIMAKRHQPSAIISFIDESYSAIKSAKENYFKENLDDIEGKDANFTISNALEQFDGEKSDLILCNPPFHQAHSIGDEIAWQMFTQSREALETDGELWIVGNRHLAYHVKLKKVFGNCKTVASNKKFVILAAKKADRLLRKEPTKRI